VPAGDAGVEAGAGGEPEGEGATLRLVMVPVATPIDQFVAADAKPRAPISFPGEWGALAARGARVIVLSDGGGPGRSVTYRTFDLDKTAPSETSGFSVEGNGKVTTGDVTIQGDRAYFAVLKPGAVSLHVYANASTTPTPMREVSFAKQPRIPAVGNIRDGRIAVAANESRVAVAWTSAKVLNNNDATGGYAVFACTQ
jgi:hypothetical protein